VQLLELEEDLKEQARRDAPTSTDILEDVDEKPARKRNRATPCPSISS
jgi:hypothetical protein